MNPDITRLATKRCLVLVCDSEHGSFAQHVRDALGPLYLCR